jgi:hypothetical protein
MALFRNLEPFTASELVSSHMRILQHVDETWESLVTTCPSEPVLAEAASHTMQIRMGVGLI